MMCAALATAIILLCGCENIKKYEYTFTDAFDTITTITGCASSKSEFDKNAFLIAERMRRYHQLFDIYNEYENMNNLCTVNKMAGREKVYVDGEIIGLLKVCREFYDMTGGRLNAAAGSLCALWHEARINNIPPEEKDIAEALIYTDFDAVEISDGGVYIKDENISIDVGAFAKGYAVEKACEGIPEGYLVNAGGNIYATGPKPDGSSWVIGITDPINGGYIKKYDIKSGAVVTSGDYERGFEYEGVYYHHIIDPETGYPAQKWKSVSVICASSVYADALSTALFLLDKEEGDALAAKYGAEVLRMDTIGGIYE